MSNLCLKPPRRQVIFLFSVSFTCCAATLVHIFYQWRFEQNVEESVGAELSQAVLLRC